MSEEIVTSPDVSDTGATGEQQVVEPSFRQFIPEDSREEAYWQSIPDDATLVKNYANAQKLIGKKGIIPPSEDDSPERWNDYYNQLGRPESADKYELPAIQDFPQEYIKPELTDNFKSWAHEAGLTPKQAASLYEKYMDYSKGELTGFQQAIEAQKNESETKLRSEWGDKYEQNIELANKVIRECGDERVKESIGRNDPVWNHPDLARFLVKIGQSISEDSLVKGTGSTVTSDVDAKLDAISRNPALLDFRHPDHKAVVAERDRLMKIKWD